MSQSVGRKKRKAYRLQVVFLWCGAQTRVCVSREYNRNGAWLMRLCARFFHEEVYIRGKLHGAGNEVV